jgi:hypothetical protein
MSGLLKKSSVLLAIIGQALLAECIPADSFSQVAAGLLVYPGLGIMNFKIV